MNGMCQALLCGKSLDEKALTVVVEGKARQYHDAGCALEAILISLKDIAYQIESLKKQLKK